MASGPDYAESLVSIILQGENVDSPQITVGPDGRLFVGARRLAPGPATLLLFASDDLDNTWDKIHDFGHNYYGHSFFQIATIRIVAEKHASVFHVANNHLSINQTKE